MGLKIKSCPSCGEKLQISKDSNVYSCLNCGLEIKDTKTTKKNKDQTMGENFKLLAKKAFDSGNYYETLKYCNKYLEINLEDFNTWLLKASSIGYLSNLRNLRHIESLNAWAEVFIFMPRK